MWVALAGGGCLLLSFFSLPSSGDWYMFFNFYLIKMEWKPDDEGHEAAMDQGGSEDTTIALRPAIDGTFLKFLYKCFQVHSTSSGSTNTDVNSADWEELKDLGNGLTLDECFAQLRLLASEGLLDGIVPYAAHQSLLDSAANAKEEMMAKTRAACRESPSVKISSRRPQTALPAPTASK